jgi:hypothetical protein
MGGSAFVLGLPLLDCFLDSHGKAFAATGKPIPTRFGTWFWGLGMSDCVFTPKTVGARYDLPPELAPLKDVKDHVNVFTKFNLKRDGAPNLCHTTGWVALRCGAVPASRTDLPNESIDVTIGRQIGGTTRFRSLEAAATGDPDHSYSFQGTNSINRPEVSPLDLYQRIFGAEFQDPNGTTFKPSPAIQLRKSAISGVLEDARALRSRVGVEDRARLDQYFTGVREVENQLDHLLTKPDPREGCVVMAAPEAMGGGLDTQTVSKRHELMTKLMVMALTCDQTRVFNMLYSASNARTAKQGLAWPHHSATHEELIDPKLGYQPVTSWYTTEAITHWARFVQALASVREGDGTLLDNSLVYAHSDQEFAKTHSIDGIPMFTAGRAGGRVKSGLHVAGGGDAGTRLGYTLLKVMGVDAPSWGTKSNTTSKEIGEILA